jgi:hypothetical protein
MIRYLIANIRYQVQSWWLILTSRGDDNAPDSLLGAYNRRTYAWNRLHNRRKREGALTVRELQAKAGKITRRESKDG